jgi:hypothetical protein
MSDSFLTDFSSIESNEISFYENLKEAEKTNEKLLKSISSIFESLINKNKKIKNYKKIIKSQKNSFFSHEKPEISIFDYLNRINKYCIPEESTLIISLILIDKFCLESKIILNEFNIHRILFSSFLISMKINEDKIFTHKYFSSVAGIDIEELKILEFDFLKIVNYNVFVSKNIYEKYYQYLNQDI